MEIVKEELESKSICILGCEFKLFMKYLLESKMQKKLLQRAVDYASTGKSCTNIDHIGLTGKWMVFVPTKLYLQIFCYMLDALEKARLAYSAKITSDRREYDSRRELPIIVYVPVSFAARYVAEVAEAMRSVLDEFHVSKRMYFKPDLFTRKRVYSGTGSHKPYIYVY